MSIAFPENITFQSIPSLHIRRAFLRAYAPFERLNGHTIVVRRLPVSSTTMRAQPIVNRNFWNRHKRHYRIDVSNHIQLEKYIPVQDLPEEVLIGWFAHELGHILDYQDRGVMGLIRFGLGYLLMPRYRMGAERQADMYAIEHGFGSHLMATKRYLLDHSSLPLAYKKRLQKFYLSPDQIAEIITDRESLEKYGRR